MDSSLRAARKDADRFFKLSRSCLTISSSRWRRRTSSRLRRLMPTARKGFGTVLSQFFAPLLNRRVGDAQLAGHLRDWLATGLRQSHRFALKLDGLGLLNLCHDLFPPLRGVYSKLLLLYKFGARSNIPFVVQWRG